MKVEVIAIEPCDNYRPGDRWMVSPQRAQELIAKRLVKMKAPHSNKMRQKPENKKNPTPAVGSARTSSALPAAQVSPQRTAQRSRTGAAAKRTDE